ncbi:MAG: transporter [Phycisphaerales bacterium]
MRTGLIRWAAGALSALMATASAAGQDTVPATGYSIFGWEAPEIVSPYEQDRANFAPSASVVPFGRFVLEAGATVTYDDENDVETTNLTTPEILVRGGLFSRVEGRLGWDGYSSTEVETTGFSDTIAGATDMTAGVKVAITENQGVIPALAVLGEVSLPVGDDDLTSDRVDPSVQIVAVYDRIDDFWRFDASGRLSFLEDTADDSFTRIDVSAGVHQTWVEGTRTFVEYFAFLTDQDSVEDAHFAQAGVIYEAAPNVILDARFGFGLTADSADMFAGAGVSFSF